MENDKYIGAPYNFVPLWKEVQKYPEKELPGHDSIRVATDSNVDLISGEIAYSIMAKTPIFIGSGLSSKGDDEAEENYRDTLGRYAIPSSTMRGLIRNNVQILSMSELGKDIDDYALMYRHVTSGKEKDKYSDILGSHSVSLKNGKGNITVLDNVKAGYLSCKNGKYYIYDVEGNIPVANGQRMNYYILSEKTVVHEYLQAKEERRDCAYGFFFQNGNILQHTNQKKFVTDKRKGRVHYINDENKNYKPYSLACSYEANMRNIIRVGMPDEYKQKGFVLSSGPMKEKKSIYIIPDMVRETKGFPIEISENDITAYKIDLKNRENSLKGLGGKEIIDYYRLPEEGENKPVFYIEYGGKLYFGFTPRLRLFYDHTIHHGLPEEHKKQELDYTRALFGYISDKTKGDKGRFESYKTRLSFTDASVTSEPAEKSPVEKAILAGPKPTSYLDYLVPDADKQGISYNEDHFELRGIKQYWLRDKAKAGVPREKESKDYVTSFKPLAEGTEFKGKIRFHNLKLEELGLLLWALTLNGKVRMNIGKGKAFGFGNVELEVIDARALDMEKAYALDNLSLEPWTDIHVDQAISCYKKQLKAFLNNQEPETQRSIKTLYQMKDPRKMPEPGKIRYMDINKGEYQTRKEPLQMPQDLIVQVKETASDGGIYEASISKTEGKKIHFRVLDLEGCYGKMSIEDVLCRTITKKELKTVFPVETHIKVQKNKGEDGKDIWKCVEILS